jgi:hypothetical protein
VTDQHPAVARETASSALDLPPHHASARRPDHSPASFWQAHAEGGSPPPPPKPPCGHPPPFESRSSRSEEKVNGKRHDPTLRPGAPRRFSRRLPPRQGGKGSPGDGWGERWLSRSLTPSCQAQDHGGNPPPRPERPRGHPPPSRSLPSEGKEKVNGRRDDPTLRPAAPRFFCSFPRGRGQWPSGGGRGERRFYHSLTSFWQAHAHGGNSPPRPERPPGHPPPSRSLSNGGEEKVNGRRDDPTLRPAAPRLSCSFPRGRGQWPSGGGRGERWLCHSLTSSRQAQDHGGNPPPRSERPPGHPPPSRSLSSEGKGKISGRRDDPTLRPDAPRRYSRASRHCQRQGHSCHGWRGRWLYYSLTSSRQAHDHGGDPPPRPEPRSLPPPFGGASGTEGKKGDGGRSVPRNWSQRPRRRHPQSFTGSLNHGEGTIGSARPRPRPVRHGWLVERRSTVVRPAARGPGAAPPACRAGGR